MGYREYIETAKKNNSLNPDKLLWEIFQQSHICLLLFSPDGNIVLANTEAEHIFGKDLISYQINDLFHSEYKIDLNTWYNSAVNGTITEHQYNYRLKTRDNQSVWGLVNFTLIKESKKAG